MVRVLTGTEVPPEFIHLRDSEDIPWENISSATKVKTEQGMDYFAAFTDAVIDLATKESMKEAPVDAIIVLGIQACLIRGRHAEALFL